MGWKNERDFSQNFSRESEMRDRKLCEISHKIHREGGGGAAYIKKTHKPTKQNGQGEDEERLQMMSILLVTAIIFLEGTEKLAPPTWFSRNQPLGLSSHPPDCRGRTILPRGAHSAEHRQFFIIISMKLITLS